MAKTEKKEFKAGLYGVVAGIIVAIILVGLTIFAFTTKYNAFSPYKIAQSYADSIVQTGDGYNALKVSVVSKNQKFGNFVINGYMAPYINEDAEQNEKIGTGSDEEAKMLDEVYNQMYDYYLELMHTVGLENYDAFYNAYFAKLKEVRVAVIGDDYMDTEFMFGVFESNVNTYGESLTGTKEKLASDNKTVVKQASTGKYQERFGEDYKLTASVKEATALNEQEVKDYVDGYKARVKTLIDNSKDKAAGLDNERKSSMEDAFAKLDIADDITNVTACTVEVKDQNDQVVSSTLINVVQIGNSWYVDNTNSPTGPLYITLE